MHSHAPKGLAHLLPGLLATLLMAGLATAVAAQTAEEVEESYNQIPYTLAHYERAGYSLVDGDMGELRIVVMEYGEYRVYGLEQL